MELSLIMYHNEIKVAYHVVDGSELHPLAWVLIMDTICKQ